MKPPSVTSLHLGATPALALRAAALSALFLLLEVWAPAAHADSVTTAVSAGTLPFAVAVNPVTNKIYVANSSSNNVTVIDGATNATSTVSAGTTPYAVAVNPVTNKIYVANQSSNSVTVIDGATNATTMVTVGTNPGAVAVNPVTNEIYVANRGSNSVAVIEGTANATTTVTVESLPNDVAVNPVTNKIYVANYTDNSVTVIDGATNATTAVTVGSGPVAVGVNPVTNKIYVANYTDNSVTVIDGATNATTAVTVGSGPVAVGVNPVTNKIYVANYSGNNVTVIAEQRTEPIPEFVSIVPLANNTATTSTPAFAFIPTSYYNPFAPLVRQIYYQVDTWEGRWSIVNSSDGTTWIATTAPLQPGVHIIYAWSADGMQATSIHAAEERPPLRAALTSSSPIIGQIAAYLFVVVPAPAVSLSRTLLAFGNQPVGTLSASQPVMVTNAGDGDLTIGGISTTADFSQTNSCGMGLPADSSCTINVTFTPSATGARNGILTISDNASGSPRTIGLSGTGIASTVSLSPNVLNFGNRQVGTTSGAQPVTLTNNGNALLTISNIATSPDFAQTNNCGASLAASAHCTINVTFTPSVASVRLGTLAVSDNATGSPQVITLAGTGTTSPIFASDHLTFATQTVGTTSAAQVATVTNVGGALVAISSIATSGDFQQANNCVGYSLNVGSSCGVHVTFRPSGGGPRTGVLTISYSGSDTPATVSLTGTGTIQVSLPLVVR